LGQTVIAKVTNLDEEKQRFLVTLKMSEVITSDGDARTRLMNGLQERKAVKEMLAVRDDSELRQQLAALSVGQKLKLMVDSVVENGAKFKSDDLPGAAILANKHHMTDCPAVVQFVDQDFAVVSLNDAAQLTLIHTCSHLNEVILFESERLKVGMTLTVEVVEPSCEQLEGLPLVLWKGSVPRRQRTTSENQTDSSGHRFGDILEGKVRSVKPTSIQVALGDGTTGSVHMSQDAGHPEKLFKLGQAVRAQVVEVSVQPHRFVLSLTGVHKLEKGSITLGMVISVHPQVGLLVKLPFGGVGTVSVTDLADSYRPNPLEMFSKDQFVSVDTEDELVDLSLLPADTGKPDVLPESLGLPLRLVGNQKKHDPKKAKKRSPSESEQVKNFFKDPFSSCCYCRVLFI
ncbi:hypothetical protein XENOCAPTIV_000763, partial [Xenoophorus captivus]